MCSRFYTRPTKLTFKWRNVTNLLMVELAILKKQVNWLHCKSDLLQYDSSFGRQCNSINTFLAMVTILYLLKILENLFQELQNGRISQKCVKGCLFGPLFSPPPVRFLPRGGLNSFEFQYNVYGKIVGREFQNFQRKFSWSK